ncbi:MAG: PRC-barrel domain-containing protein [Thermostichales cyanobacterium SRBZ-1_bins_19]
MTAELLLRSQVLGTQVINQADAARVGIVSQVWVDPERQEVLVLSSREQAFGGSTQTLYLGKVTAVGPDAILIPNEEAFEDLDLSDLERVVGSEVITEDGLRLGKVKDFQFDRLSGEITSLILSSWGIPLLPGFLVSTYQLDAEEIRSMGRDRIMVRAGAETRLEQLSRSIFEQLGLGKPPWLQEAMPPALPSAATGPAAEEEEYEERYEEDAEEPEGDYEAEEETASVYAPEPKAEAAEEEPEPVNPPVADYAAEYDTVENIPTDADLENQDPES